MSDSKQPVLEVRNLSVALPKGGDRVHAVEKVSFTVNPGEIVCLVERDRPRASRSSPSR